MIWPSVAPVSIQLWKELYLAHTSAASWTGLLQCAKEIKQNHTAVRKIAGQLQNQIKRTLEVIKSDTNASGDSESQGDLTRLAQLNLESQSA